MSMLHARAIRNSDPVVSSVSCANATSIMAISRVTPTPVDPRTHPHPMSNQPHVELTTGHHGAGATHWCASSARVSSSTESGSFDADAALMPSRRSAIAAAA